MKIKAVLTSLALCAIAYNASLYSMGYELDVAITSNNIPEIRELIAAGADINAKFVTGFTPLTKAIFAKELYGRDNLELVQTVLELGANPNKDLDSYNFTALTLATQHGKLDISRELIAHDAYDLHDAAVARAAHHQEWPTVLLLLTHKERRELMPSDDMFPWLTHILKGEEEATEFLQWWKAQDPEELAIENKINITYSLCARPQDLRLLSPMELSNFYDAHKQ